MAHYGVKLFLSCVSDEFGGYRDALRSALTRPNVEVKIQEEFKLLGGDTLRTLEEYIDQCEAVVHFVGDWPGSTPAASGVEDLLARRHDLGAWLEKKGLAREALVGLTYTQWEAWLAIYFDKNLLIVVPAPGVAPGPPFAPTQVILNIYGRRGNRRRSCGLPGGAEGIQTAMLLAMPSGNRRQRGRGRGGCRGPWQGEPVMRSECTPNSGRRPGY
jgi:hypothetical protein